MEDQSRIEIVGQKIFYPTTWPQALGLLTICLTICACGWILFIGAKVENLHIFTNASLWRSVVVDASGKSNDIKGIKVLQFWTPSIKTKMSKEAKSWESIDSDSILEEFGSLLRNDSKKRITGYRRHEVYGHGNSVPKWGWWWSITVTEDFTPDDFIKIYRGFWKTEGSIYVEIIGDAKPTHY